MTCVWPAHHVLRFYHWTKALGAKKLYYFTLMDDTVLAGWHHPCYREISQGMKYRCATDMFVVDQPTDFWSCRIWYDMEIWAWRRFETTIRSYLWLNLIFFCFDLYTCVIKNFCKILNGLECALHVMLMLQSIEPINFKEMLFWDKVFARLWLSKRWFAGL